MESGSIIPTWKVAVSQGRMEGQDRTRKQGMGASRAARILSWGEEEAVSWGVVILLPRGAHVHQPGQAAGAGHGCQARRCPISLGPVGWTCFLCPRVHPDHLILLFYTSDSQQNYFCQNLCYDSRRQAAQRAQEVQRSWALFSSTPPGPGLPSLLAKSVTNTSLAPATLIS